MKGELAVVFLAALAVLATAESAYPPHYERFWEGAPFYSMLCADNLPLLNLEEARPMQSYELDRLSAIGGSGSALRFASDAGKELGAAKEESTLSIFGIGRFPLYEDYVYAGIAAGSVFAPNPLLSVPESCLLDYFSIPNLCHEVKRAACAGMERSTKAITLASFAAEDARNAAYGEAQELEVMGAGCQGYSGTEGAVLANAYSSLNRSERFTESAGSAQMVSEAFARGGARFSDADAYSSAMNSIIGGEGVVAEWSGITSSLRTAQQSMRASFNASLESYKLERKTAEAELSRLRREGYERIDYAVFAGGSGEARGSLHANSPREELRQADAMLREAGYLAAEAGSLSKAGGRMCHLSDALLRLQDAGRKVGEARISIAETEQEADDWLDGFESSASARLRSARSQLYSFNATAPGAAGLKSRAQAELDKAEGLLDGARYADAGEKALKLEDAIGHIGSAESLLSSENAGRSELLALANSSVSRLESAIGLAEKDGIGCQLEKEFVSLAVESLPFATAEDSALLDSQARALEDGIYAKAKLKFGYLGEELASLSGSLGAVRAYAAVAGNPSQLKEAIDSVEEIRRDFCSGDEIDAHLALGNYGKIAQQLADAEDAFSSGKDGLIQGALTMSARVSCGLIGQAVLDEPVAQQAHVSFENPYPFGSSGAVRVEIPNSCGFASASSKGSGFTSIYADERTITAMLEEVGANAAYSAYITGPGEVIARTTGNSTEMVSLGPEEAGFVAAIQFNSAKGLDALTARFRPGVPPSYFSASAENAAVLSTRNGGDGLEVLLGRVSEGAGSVSLRYAVSNPFSIGQENWEVERTGNTTFNACFDAVVRAKIQLPQIPASVALHNVTAGSDFSITREGEPVDFEASQAANGLELSWQASEGSYRICFSFQNAGAYANSLLSDAEERLQMLESTGQLLPEELDGLSNSLQEARSLVSSKKNADAVRALQEFFAKAGLYERAAGARLGQRNSFSEAQGEWNAESESADGIVSALASAGIGSGFPSCVSRAGSIADSAEELAAQGNFAEAGQEQLEALDALRSCDASKQVSEKLDALEGRKSALESESAALARFSIAKPAGLADAESALADARAQLSTSNIVAAVRSAVAAGSLLENASTVIERGYASVEANLTSEAEQFKLLKPRAEKAMAAFEKAAVPSEAAPSGSAARGLGGSGLLENATGQLGQLSSFFAAFSASSSKRDFIAANAESAAVSGRGLAELNSSAAMLANSTSAYERLANELLGEALLKVSQAQAILPESSQYSKAISDANESASLAKEAFGDARFADSIIASEKAIAGCSRLLSAASQVEQAGAGSGFSLQPVHLLLPGLLLALGFVYFKGKEKKPELRKIPRGGEARGMKEIGEI